MSHRVVYRMPKAGNIAQLTLQEESLLPPGPQEVQVNVKAIGLNFADVFAMFGLYSATPKGSFIPGLEYAGIIQAVGSEIKNWKAGDAIMGVCKFGAYTQTLNIDHRYVIPLPLDWSFAQGAAYPVQALTAYYALIELGNLQRGQTVLIHSAAGGVGLLANRIAKHYDAYTLGTVGSAHKLALLQQEGYDQGIVRAPRFAKDLQEALGGRPLHLVLECIGGKILRQSWKAMAPMGRLISYGSAQYASETHRPQYLKLLYHYLQRPRIDVQNMINLNKSVMAFNLIHLYEHVDLMNRYLDALSKLSLAAPYVGHEYEWGRLPEAVHFFQTGQSVGKIIVRGE